MCTLKSVNNIFMIKKMFKLIFYNSYLDTEYSTEACFWYLALVNQEFFLTS